MRLAWLSAIVAALVVAVAASAAFVDRGETAQPVSADDVVRWLGLEAPAAGSCAAPASTAATGTDRALVVAAGGAGAGGGAGRTLDCAFVLHARDPLPEGVTAMTVTAERLDDAANPVTAMALTALDGSGPGASIELAPGERGAVRLTVLDRPAARGLLTLTVSFTGEQSGFLRYTVPVDVCADTLASSCTPPVVDPGPGPSDPGTPPAGGTTPPVGGSAPSVGGTAPSTSKPKPKPTTRICTSRRTVNIRLKRSWKNVRDVRVTIQGKRVKAKRAGRRIRATIDLRNRPRTRVTVRITARGRTGRRLTDTRRYWTCTPKRKSAPKKKAPAPKTSAKR